MAGRKQGRFPVLYLKKEKKMEKKMIVALFREILGQKYEKLIRKIGPRFNRTGLVTKENKLFLLGCLEEAFNDLIKDEKRRLGNSI